MTTQQELELLAEWLGIEVLWDETCQKLHNISLGYPNGWFDPSPAGTDTDFLNMVAGRVDFYTYGQHITASTKNACGDGHEYDAYFTDYNNEKLAAMKHAAYQVCLMAAGEWKGEKNG